MAEKNSAQQYPGLNTPSALQHASLQHAAPAPEIQPEPRQPPENKAPPRLMMTLANITCLAVALWYVWSTHDILGFVLLYGIVTGAINAREVAGTLLPRRFLKAEDEKEDTQL